MQKGIKYQVSKIPANVPLKLIKLFRQENESFSALAKRLDVNKGMLWKLIREGIEPHDHEIRKKVFLPGRVRPPLEAWIRQATENLRELREKAQPPEEKNRVYDRKGRRVR